MNKQNSEWQNDIERANLLKEMVYEPLKRDWENYRAVQLGQDAIFLKTIASMAAGAFGVSFAFINALFPFQKANYREVLITGWAAFASTIALVLVCYLASSFIHSKHLDDIELNIKEGYEGKPYSESKRWYYGVVTGTLEILSFIGFTGGMVCVVLFVLLNL